MINLPFQKLLVWQKGLVLVKDVYRLTREFPPNELYGLTQQIRRAAVSVPSNIAEGSQRGSDKEFQYFLRISKGSLAELETQIILAQELGYLSSASADALLGSIVELSKMLRAFLAKMTIR